MSKTRSSGSLVLALGAGLLAAGCGGRAPGDPILRGIVELGEHQLDFGVTQASGAHTLRVPVWNVGTRSLQLAVGATTLPSPPSLGTPGSRPAATPRSP